MLHLLRSNLKLLIALLYAFKEALSLKSKCCLCYFQVGLELSNLRNELLRDFLRFLKWF